jgi:hypothetical protein
MAIMSLFHQLPPDAVLAQNFFDDFAAYAQFFVGIPLFIIAERTLSDNILSAVQDFDDSGVVAPADKARLAQYEKNVSVSSRKLLPDLLCLGIGFVLALMTIGPKLFWHSDMKSWHVTKLDETHRYLTPAGAWEMLVALPIQIYWWVRWIWKIGLWYWYLSRVSKFKLVLVASHPDHTGGIAFLSEVQAKFAIIILAFGISNVVATIGYKLEIEHAPITLPAVWGPMVGFTIGAPLLFLCPLLLFTRQLRQTKNLALAKFREKAMLSAKWVEEEWLHAPPTQERDALARNEMSQLNLLTGFYERIRGMRVVPFDLRSAGQLIGSAIGPMVPLIPYFVQLPKEWQAVLEALTKWLPHH